MTTFIPFTPSNRKAPSFMPTLDGITYTVTVFWNVSAQRYYFNCQGSNGNLIFMIPLVENPMNWDIKSLVWDRQNERVILEVKKQHHIQIGRVVYFRIINNDPNEYNGDGFCTILSDTQITYPMITDPGEAGTLGSIVYIISMTKAYFDSTIAFRDNVFAINP